MKTILKLSFTALCLMLASTLYANSQPTVVTHKADGSFEDIFNNIRDSIEGMGINVAHVLPAGDMLHRTGSPRP